jgi:formylglycine-generating enzyme required for sulfatase activity
VGKRYPWGDELGTGNANDNLGGAASVGTYLPNGYGLYDMGGNVFEWVWDWSSANYGPATRPWAVNGVTNPNGPEAPENPDPGATRVRKGGGYNYGSRFMKVFERMFRVPTYTAPYFGFRSVTNQP